MACIRCFQLGGVDNPIEQSSKTCRRCRHAQQAAVDLEEAVQVARDIRWRAFVNACAAGADRADSMWRLEAALAVPAK